MAVRTFHWLDADGGDLSLSSVWEYGAPAGIGVLAGIRGLEMPPVEQVYDQIPFQAGGRHRHLQVRPRTVDLPLHIRSLTAEGLRQFVRVIRRAFDPSRGDGALRVVTVDGLTRDLICRYIGQWTGDESQGAYGVVWQDCLITLQALDPYWYAAAPTTLTFAIEAGLTTFFPLLPLDLSVSSLLGDNVVVNGGDVLAWPVWTLDGPADVLTLENLTAVPPTVFSVRTNAITGAGLAVGEQIVVDTRPGQKTVVGPGPTNYYAALEPGAQLWPLLPGEQTIRLTVTGASASTVVRLDYMPRFLGL